MVGSTQVVSAKFKKSSKAKFKLLENNNVTRAGISLHAA